MHDLLIIFFFILICISSLRNIQTGFAMILAVDFIIPRAVTFMGVLPLREIFMLVAWGFFWYHGVVKREYKLTFRGIYNKPLFFFFTCIFIILLFSSGEAGIGMQLKHIFGLIYYLSFAYIAWTIYNNEKKIRQFYKIILTLSIVMGVYGIFCYLTMSNPYILMLEDSSSTNIIAAMDEIRGGLEGRTQSTMTHPITWGATASLMLLFCISKEKKNAIKYALPILLFINVFLSGSRSALIALVISIFCILIYKKNIKILLSAISIISIIIVIILYTPVFQGYKGLMESTIFFWNDDISIDNDIQGSSVAMRSIQILGVLEMISDNPLFGLGHGYVDYYYNTHGVHPILFGFESLILNKLAEGGWVDLFVWIYLFGILYLSIEKIKKKYCISKDATLIKSYVIFYFVFSLLSGFMSTFLYFIVIYAVLIRHLMTYRLSNPKRISI